MTSSIVVWDAPADPPSAEGLWYWRKYAPDDRAESVPRYLESHGERLRARYLAFIHELGERQIDGRRLVEHLDLGDGFSFWWMTQLAEKSPLK